MQRNKNYSGIWGIHDQDRALAESSKPAAASDPGIVDRAGEHLVTSDRAIVTARRRLLKMAEDLQKGIEPTIPHQAHLFGVRAISKICPQGGFDELLEIYGEEARYPGSTVA